MRRLHACALAALLAAAPALAPALAHAMTLGLNQSAKVRLSAPARNVVVANPAIADVNVVGARDIVIIGKGYGAADVVVTDAQGRTLFSEQVSVRADEGAEVAYVRGGETRNFACNPHCRPAETSAPRP